jgi:hypothetical protein
VERVTGEWIGAGLDEALDFCRELGLGRQVDRSRRFQEHRACLAELTEALQVGGQDAARDLFESNRLRALTAFTEGWSELVESLPFIRTVPRDIIGRKLAAMLQGPPLPTDEDPNTNQGRKIVFELTMASKLWRAVLAPELVEPDIRCQVDGRAVYVACKRPFSEKSARQAYADALGQIADVLKEAPKSRGVVALSLTRLINPGDRVLKHENEEIGKRYLSSEMGPLAQEMISTTDWPPPPTGTMGILWHVITAGFDRSQALSVAAQQLNVQPTGPLVRRTKCSCGSCTASSARCGTPKANHESAADLARRASPRAAEPLRAHRVE